jgi:hypothetical protein
MGIFGMLFGGVQRMNADPDQQQFAKLFIAAAEDTGMRGEINLTNWLVSRPWAVNPKETRTRIGHALSIVKISSLPPTYKRACEIGKELHMASYRLG